MTADEFLELHGHELSVDLFRGVIVRYPPSGARRGKVSSNVTFEVGKIIDEWDWGFGFINDTLIQTEWNPDTLRGIDVGFISYRRFPRDRKVPVGPIDIPPEFVFEIVRPTDTAQAVHQLVKELLAVGVVVVAVVDPHLELVSVYRKDELPVRFHNGDDFTLPDVLPGFSVPLKSFFT